jgi:chemotaxis protein MotD
MVLQRQVPARPAAKAGEGFSAGDAADGNRNDTFSAALSQEKRSSAAERDKVQSGNQSGTEGEASETDEQVSAGSGQSDEILNLLSGLKSSAAYADEAELGNSTSGEEDVLLEAAIGEPKKLQAETDDVLAEADGEPVDANEGPVEKADRTATAQRSVTDANPAALASAVPAAEASARPSATEKAAGTQGKQTAADQASNTTPVAKSETVSQATDIKSNQAPVDAKSTATPAQVASAASGLAGQSAQLQPRAAAASNGSDLQKDPSAVKEAMRALGVEGASGLANADAAKARGRNAGKQDGADDKRIDELTGKKDGKVEVIESRRFMPAQNLSANAQMLTRTLAEAGTSALAAQRAAPAQPLAQTALSQTGQTLHTLKLQLNPISLGSVTAVLKLSGDDLSVEIKVQTAEAYRQLKEDNQSILKALRGQGFGVEQITVQHVVGNERASNQTAQPGFQSSQQGPGSNDAQSFGKDGNRNNAGQQQSGSRGGQGNEPSSYSGSGAGRTDGVYL